MESALSPNSAPARDSLLPQGDDTMARDAMWYAYAIGAARPAATAATPPTTLADLTADTEVASAAVESAAGGARTALPYGTIELLEQASYPHGRPGLPGPDPDHALGCALVAAFGLQRREPENPFNDHRAYASVRSKFPVQVFVTDARADRLLDVYRHALVELPAAGPREERPAPPEDRREIVLTARYTRLPSAYKWFRGSLLNLELGINLRTLCVGLELFGLSGRLRLPDADSHDLLVALGLVPTWEWTLPLVVELDSPRTAPTTTPSPPTALRPLPATALPVPIAPDPVLAEVVAVNRAQAFGGPPETIGPAIAPDIAQSPLSWAELLWKRSSGRMPRGLYGMNGRRRRLPAAALSDVLGWLAAAPPGESLRAVGEYVTASVVLQDVDGSPDGVYRVAGGKAVLVAASTTAAAELEEQYGYPLAPGNGCDLRHASMLWFFSVRPRETIGRFGPGGWSAAQYACGWFAQGLSLAAAAWGLYARPARAFQEAPAQRVLGLDPEEMIALSVIVGTPRYSGPMFDLRL